MEETDKELTMLERVLLRESLTPTIDDNGNRKEMQLTSRTHGINASSTDPDKNPALRHEARQFVNTPGRQDFFGDSNFDRNMAIIGNAYQSSSSPEIDGAYIVPEITEDDEEFATFEERALKSDNIVCGYNIYMNRIMIKLAEELRYIKNNKFYTCNDNTWAEYTASVGISRHKANRMIRVVDILDALKRSGQHPDIGNVEEVRLIRFWVELVEYNPDTKTVKDPEAAMELLEAAKTLSWSDFKIVQAKINQRRKRPEAEVLIDNGQVIDSKSSTIVGNYQLEKADSNKHHMSMSLSSEYIKKKGDSIPIVLDAVKLDLND